MERLAIVVPTIRENCIRDFLAQWKNEFDTWPNRAIFVVEDNPTKTFRMRDKSITHLAWDDIDRELGQHSWIIPRRTDCVRSFGYYKAFTDGADIIITLDDDCYPLGAEPYLIQTFVNNLNGTAHNRWLNTLHGRLAGYTAPLFPRGYPYTRVPVVLSHGLWAHIPDLDGKTQLANPDLHIEITHYPASPVPHGSFFPMCGMNLAFRREILPALYFLLMGQDRDGKRWGYDRFGDIWAGVFAKKIIDHLNYTVLTGQPVIHHSRASRAEHNAILETPGLEVNEWLWREVAAMTLSASTPRDCYRELAEKLPARSPYFVSLKKAMRIWVELFA